MGKYKQGILGPFMGKVGQVIGRVWKGIYYMAAVPTTFTDAKTNGQLKVRARFARLAELSQKFRAAIVYGFKGVKKMTVYDRFVQANWPQVTAASPDDVTVNYAKLKIAEGKLAGITIGAVDYGEDTHLTVKVPITGSQGGIGADSDDDVYLFAYCPDLNTSILGTPVKRSAANATLTVPANWDGQTIQLYAFARSSSVNALGPDICSDSLYCGTGEIN